MGKMALGATRGATSGSGAYLLAVLDRHLTFKWVNGPFARAAGRSPEDLAGTPFFAACPNRANEAIFRRVMEIGRPFTARSGLGRTLGLSGGSNRRWDCELSPVRGTDGQVTGLVLVLRSATPLASLERDHLQPSALGRRMGEKTGHIKYQDSPPYSPSATARGA